MAIYATYLISENSGKLKKMLISGGSTDLKIMRTDVTDETIKVAQLLKELGVKKEDIILERKAKNTRENAVNSVEILKKNPQFGTKYLLFTRELSLFEAYNLVHEITGYVVYKILGYC